MNIMDIIGGILIIIVFLGVIYHFIDILSNGDKNLSY